MSKKNLTIKRFSEEVEPDCYYATPPEATELFLNNFRDTNSLKKVWEPACGEGHISEVLLDYMIDVRSTDKVDRGYGEVLDFLNCGETYFYGSIITNPPFDRDLKIPFLEKALEVVPVGESVIFFHQLSFLETQTRRRFHEKHLHSVYIHSDRVGCAKNGDFSKVVKGVPYAWYVFKKSYERAPMIYWI